MRPSKSQLPDSWTFAWNVWRLTLICLPVWSLRKITFLSTNVALIPSLAIKSNAGAGVKRGGWEWTPGLGKNLFRPPVHAFGFLGERGKSRGRILVLRLLQWKERCEKDWGGVADCAFWSWEEGRKKDITKRSLNKLICFGKFTLMAIHDFRSL